MSEIVNLPPREAARPAPLPCKVWLIGAGPGAADLLTRRAERALAGADVVLYDSLITEEVLALSPPEAERVFVGKRKGAHSMSQEAISALIITHARAGRKVARLKSGDPSVYGRAGEEMEALAAAGIDFEIVPGITAALAAAADAKLSLTRRGVASTLVFATGHSEHGEVLPDWANLALSGATVAVYMGRTVAGRTAARLIRAGLSPATPVMAVENASRTDQKLLAGRLDELDRLAVRSDVSGPVLILIGRVAAESLSRDLRPLAEKKQEGAYAILREAS